MAGSLYAGAAVTESVPLAPLTTLRVGPVVRRLVTCTSTDQIVAALGDIDGAGERPLVLGGGSNVVVGDTLTELTVVRLASPAIEVNGAVVRAEAGAVWDDVVRAAIDAGLGGLECLSGIPGSAGATPVQNVGAYGAEVADTLTRARILDRRSGEVRWLAADALAFGYRTSRLKHGPDAGRLIVLEVEFALDATGASAPLRYGELTAALGAAPGDRADPIRVREAVLGLRRGKGMVLDATDHDTWSVGSFFTNPVVPAADFERLRSLMGGAGETVPGYPADGGVKLAAGWLVERAGFGKGFPGPGAAARLSTKHALALTNRGGAGSDDIVALARRVRDGVRTAFGIELVPEPVLVGLTL
ncbi:UDP-N-acetylmuramate dehydrogenase [Mycolicibacterium palauense]|uniref:UDP-N-acetylmuramate dehydrogenase n=1 Tax=Mycolicibacterium palauense TaxID=2034511 RepID=UPI000BFECAD5|nr:UDP-N-acetylmuramate dehydrogenase [Mycolicibacterium palauense]